MKRVIKTIRSHQKTIRVLQTGFFCLLILIAQNLYSQYTGYKYFKNYSYKEYDHAPQNWGIVQDKNGIIYVANHGGVLTFDGVSWRIIGTPKYDTVRSMAVDQAGTVFMGKKRPFRNIRRGHEVYRRCSGFAGAVAH